MDTSKQQDAASPPTSDARAAAPTELSAEEVVALRSGDVLLRHTILKSDHFPGCQNTRLSPLLDGAPNYRQVPDLPVYGVAIPTVSGLRTVLDRLGAGTGRKVLWHNLREEPVLYVNGRPFVCRQADKPFANLEYTGIDRHRVEDMEARLKADVLAEAEMYGGSVMVAHEDDNFQVVEDWEPVTEVDVLTPAEVYEELIKDGYDVDYLRVPVTDEKAPKGDDIEVLVSRCWAPPEGAALVFNCQMGRGRTTTGMIIGCLLHLRRVQGTLAPPPAEPLQNLPQWYVAAPEGLSPRPGGSHAFLLATSGCLDEVELKSGGYAVIRSLLRALERGKEAKEALDLVLDACSAMQNLREAIASYRTKLFYEANDMRRQSLMEVSLEYLDRYYVLVVFAAYLDDPSFSPGSPDHSAFEAWNAARPELQGILQRLLRSNPLAALALDRAGSPGAAAATAAKELTAAAGEDEVSEEEEILAHRDGSVLGPRTILKQDHFPGCQSARLPALVSGAPNFRGVPGDEIRVFGGAIATADGVRRVLDWVGAGPEGTAGSTGSAAVWHMMREEPVVYLCGQPYVLREESRPFKNLLEYRGIAADRLDQMEQRLRNDIIDEASKEGGRILATLEVTGDGGDGRSLKQEYVAVPGPEAVATPRQVFRALQEEGYRVTFLRIPLTDGTCPRPKDFDAFYSAAAAAGPTDALIYSCQLGGGRTTTGMAIGTLLRMHLNGAELPLASEMERAETLERLDEDLGGTSPRGGSDDEDEEQYRRRRRKSMDPRTVSAAVLAARAKEEEEAAAFDPEAKNLQEGEYVGMRRFTRTLERGADAKAEVDSVVDACGVLINLRTSIMRYRRPKRLQRFFRPEIQARHSAFQRGSAYLERYCMLVVFSAYLRQCRHRGRRMTFEEWLSARPDVAAAREALHQNPAGALAPVPSVAAFTISPAKGGLSSFTDVSFSTTPGRNVPPDEQRRVLLRRKGSTVGRRSILKSFTVVGRGPAGAPPVPSELRLEGITDCRRALGLPVLTAGNASVDGLRRLLGVLGARPNGPAHVIITDLREELVLYVNGVAYLRRELEMPAAALHHAGIQAAKLEDLERRLRADMLTEAISWGGRVLLHREVESEGPAPAQPHPSQPDVSLVQAAAPAPANDGSVEDITKTTIYQSTAQVAAFWELTGDVGDIDTGMCTPAEVFVGLAAEGYQISYRRVPLSRERTPQAADLDHLHAQISSYPGGKRPTYLFISRTASGSSARFAAAAACVAHLTADGVSPRSAAAVSPAVHIPGAPCHPPPHSGEAAAFEEKEKAAALSSSAPSGISPLAARARGSAATLMRNDSDLSDLVRSVQAGEYRGVMNLCRVLPGGSEAKAAVDEAIDACAPIGNLREDILKCKQATESDESVDPSVTVAARRLGLHYLTRYAFLIAFRAFLDSRSRGPFSEWVDQRREISYLLWNLELT